MLKTPSWEMGSLSFTCHNTAGASPTAPQQQSRQFYQNISPSPVQPEMFWHPGHLEPSPNIQAPILANVSETPANSPTSIDLDTMDWLNPSEMKSPEITPTNARLTTGLYSHDDAASTNRCQSIESDDEMFSKIPRGKSCLSQPTSFKARTAAPQANRRGDPAGGSIGSRPGVHRRGRPPADPNKRSANADRLERNRMAAYRCRERKREKEKKSEAEMEKLKKQQAILIDLIMLLHDKLPAAERCTTVFDMDEILAPVKEELHADFPGSRA